MLCVCLQVTLSLPIMSASGVRTRMADSKNPIISMTLYPEPIAPPIITETMSNNPHASSDNGTLEDGLEGKAAQPQDRHHPRIYVHPHHAITAAATTTVSSKITSVVNRLCIY